MEIEERALQLCRILHAPRYRFASEAELQSQVGTQLADHGIPFVREMALTPQDRIDFLCGPIGIEVKVGGSPGPVFRQLARYASHPDIASLVLLTTRSSHRNVPRQICGKPIFLVYPRNSIFS